MKNIFLLGLIIQTLTSFGQKTMTNYYNEYTKAHKKEVYQVDNNGYRNGSYKKYFEDGQLAESCTYVKNKVNGVRKLYWELREVNYETGVHTCGGQPLKEEYWINGVESGTWKTWNCGSGGTRKLKEVTKYKKGEVYYELKYHDNGKKYEENNYPNGLYSSWYENGNLEEQYTYVNGNTLGSHKKYFKSGKIKLKKITKKDSEGITFLDEFYTYFENGNLKSELHRVPGKKIEPKLMRAIKFRPLQWTDRDGEYCSGKTYKEDGTLLNAIEVIVPSYSIKSFSEVAIFKGDIILEDGNIGSCSYVFDEAADRYLFQVITKTPNGNLLRKEQVTTSRSAETVLQEFYHENGSIYITGNTFKSPNGDTIQYLPIGLEPVTGWDNFNEDSYEGDYKWNSNLPPKTIPCYVFFKFILVDGIPNGIKLFPAKKIAFDSLSNNYDGYAKYLYKSYVKEEKSMKIDVELMTFDGELICKTDVSNSPYSDPRYGGISPAIHKFNRWKMKIKLNGKEVYLRGFKEVKESDFKSKEKYLKFIDKIDNPKETKMSKLLNSF